MVDGDATAILIELADAQDASLQPWDVGHPGEGAVLDALVDEDDVVASFYLGDGAIDELDLSIDLCVELGEEVLGTSHMVGGARVQHPPTAIMLLRWTEVSKDLLLHDLHTLAR
jgi:hypothetical protein